MLSDLIAIAVAVGGAGMIAVSFRQAKTKGWGGSLQMMAAGFLLIGASVVGMVELLAGLVNPLRWLGVVALGIGAVLFMAGQRLEGRHGSSRRDEVEGKSSSEESGAPKSVEGKKKDSGTDDDMSDIEDILRRHGIE